MKETTFVCNNCDAQFLKWTGRCLECGKWGTIEEAPLRYRSGQASSKKQSSNKFQISNLKLAKKVVDLSQTKNQRPMDRIRTGFAEFDKVIGGGITPSSVLLLGGDPGVGKSTLALQIACLKNLAVLYVSAEESESQINSKIIRFKDYKIASQGGKALKFVNEDNVETIIATIIQEKPQLVVIDSIQTIYSEEVESNIGNINQIRTGTAKLVALAKSQSVGIIIIGHVTKEGNLAGPKTMEHLVDTVLYLEGDKYKQYRILRAVKNRFGPTDEVSILEMTKEGLRPVVNPSKIFLAQAHHQPGSVICAVAEGSQVFLVEVQALVSKTYSNYPKRQTSGFDQKRLELLATVISKKAGINLANFDVYLNIAGGLSLKEPALDLAVCSSIISAYLDKVLPEKFAVFGEVGLGGEVRNVAKTKERVKEALKLGFNKIILPYFESEVKNAGLIKIKEVKEIIKLL